MICPHCQRDTDFSPEQLEQASYAKAEKFLFTCKQEAWFAEWWSLYPRKVAKAAALKAWRKVAMSEAVKDEIIAGLKPALNEWRGLPAKFIPHAATWLNGRRWEDEPVNNSNQLPRVIACSFCGDSGIMHVPERIERGLRVDAHYARCSCSRGSAPGLLIPEEHAPF